MSQFDYIANYYGKQFKRGQRVLALGKAGTVTGATHHVKVRLDSLNHSLPYHPDDVVAKHPGDSSGGERAVANLSRGACSTARCKTATPPRWPTRGE